MSERPYPEGLDCVWLACDREDHLGAFITAGVGPIPAEALNPRYVRVEEIESLVCDMPIHSTARLLVSVKRPDDFIDLAERGIFVYDWADVHRTAHASVHAYEPVAAPAKPIKVGDIPLNLAASAKAATFMDLVFADGMRIDVRSHMKCREGGDGPTDLVFPGDN